MFVLSRVEFRAWRALPFQGTPSIDVRAELKSSSMHVRIAVQGTLSLRFQALSIDVRAEQSRDARMASFAVPGTLSIDVRVEHKFTLDEWRRCTRSASKDAQLAWPLHPAPPPS